MTMHTALAHLDEPPDLAAVGIGMHGPAGHVDVFSLPHLWQLHLYDYEADLAVNGTERAIRPSWVSLVPPGAEVRYRYRGRPRTFTSTFAWARLELPTMYRWLSAQVPISPCSPSSYDRRRPPGRILAFCGNQAVHLDPTLRTDGHADCTAGRAAAQA
ncbi:hypothetical protein [Streptomyces sp. NPDC002082]|uniref:hypothetical protein n=1 Tax=Streptomyces sp. NPDC002082 TaxID=3154772 RepID=UPI00331979B2